MVFLFSTVIGFLFTRERMRQFDCFFEMQTDFRQRHLQKHRRRDVIESGEPIAVEQFVAVAYQEAGSGRKKPRNRYAADAQSRGSSRSIIGGNTPDSAAIIVDILRSRMTTSPS